MPKPFNDHHPVVGRSGSWLHAAACRDMDPAVFYSQDDTDRGLAFATCASCPVREECLQDALTAEEQDSLWFGIRGGLSARNRKRVAMGLVPVAAIAPTRRPKRRKSRPRRRKGRPDLTGFDASVAQLTSDGWTVRHIADVLHVHPRTVERARRRNRQRSLGVAA